MRNALHKLVKFSLEQFVNVKQDGSHDNHTVQATLLHLFRGRRYLNLVSPELKS